MIYPWVALETELLDLPEMAECGPLGFAFYCAALQYSARNGTDGLVPTSKFNTLLDFAGVRVVGTDNPSGRCECTGDDTRHTTGREIAAHLVRVGMFQNVGGGICLPRFHLNNRTSEQREAARVAAVAAGKRGAARRWNKLPGDDKGRASVPAVPNPAPHPATAPAPPADPEVTRLVLAMFNIWNRCKHPNQNAVGEATVKSGTRRYVLCADLLQEIDGDLDLFEAMVRAFAASPFHNGMQTGPWGIDQLVKEDKRERWIDDGRDRLTNANPSETPPDPFDESAALTSGEDYMQQQLAATRSKP